MAKVIKCAGNSDTMTLKAEDDGDVLNMVFESTNGDRLVFSTEDLAFLVLLPVHVFLFLYLCSSNI